MAHEHVPEAPTNVTALATGSTTMTVTWDPPRYAGSSSLSGYDVVATDSNGHTTEYSVGAGASALHLSSLTADATYTFKVAARNTSGASPFTPASTSVATVLSTSALAKDEARKVKGRFSLFRRTTLTASQPADRPSGQVPD